jgi:transporter family protein
MMNWIGYALLSAVFAGATAVLAKVGVQQVSSNLATAIRTAVIMTMVWALVAARGELGEIKHLQTRGVVFLVLSALATGLSWLAYFKALQLAPASRVAPIDKLSLPFSVLLAVLFLGESLNWRLAIGIALMTAGALFTISA